MTPSGIEPATFRFVAQRHCPHYQYQIPKYHWIIVIEPSILMYCYYACNLCTTHIKSNDRN
jgi:hypothetical protein